ncbi:G patch domain-containing protein 1 homolog [Trichogramma pretiosum]|uniref:G patch domain-containing protein 1 homolog n=1 Tax=Trichogramma pretiosum TaxID=7493 RepID=UPI0006C9A76E|nr:G patch domain-containing protein 1 homolog [Trichogramma pretiosum]
MSDEDDDFVTYGTALDPLDEDNLPRKKPVTIEDQIAVDAQGRRRFHGAFTGGFSAGYFNSVGSRDGWRPQQFKSTRSSKAGNVTQRPEDFMDDEDVGEFGIAPTAIRATQEYSAQTSRGTKRERSKASSDGPIPGTPVLHELLKPAKERVGVTLLKKMGWRPGQGVGPRLTKKEKKQIKHHQEKVKVYGCFLPSQQTKSSGSDDECSDDEFVEITFAPDDYEPYRCKPKDNYFGIGYSGLDRRPVLSQHFNLFDEPAFKVSDKNKKFSIKGQAFGVGAFEAEDDDIYAREDMSLYDSQLGPEKKEKSRWSKNSKDTECLEGFVKSKGRLEGKKIFAAPTLPQNFDPIHKIRKSRFAPLPAELNKHVKRHEMNAESRSKILNDDRPSIINSQSSKEAKSTSVAVKVIERTLNLHGKEQIAARKQLEESQPKKSSMSWLDKISATTFVKGEVMGSKPMIQGCLQDPKTFAALTNDNQTASSEKNLVKPTFADLDKQNRFKQYLNYTESERKLKFGSCQPLSMTEWERDQEIAEFEKAVKLCENIDKIVAAEKEKEQVKEPEKIIDLNKLSEKERMLHAARIKMFGKLTRTDNEWKPVKIVCVRFNIAEPSVGVAVEGVQKKKFSIFDNVVWDEMSKFENGKSLERELYIQPSTSRFLSVDEEPQKIISDLSLPKQKGMTDEEKSFKDSYDKVFGKEIKFDKKVTEDENTTNNQDNQSCSQEKTNVDEKMDLFKAIFLDSSDEDEEETSKSENLGKNDEKLKNVLLGKSTAEINVQRNDSPPRGIFAEIDLDNLLKKPLMQNTKKADQSVEDRDLNEKISLNESKSTEQIEDSSSEDDPMDVYGPALPKELVQIDATSRKPIFTKKNADDKLWIEKKDKKSKKDKKKHKHKERSRSKSKKSKKDKKHKS